MADDDFWKERYQDKWEAGNSREEFVKGLLEDAGYAVEDYGFAARSTEFVSGSADEHGHEKGDPDLFIEDAETYVEVTGTDVASVDPEDPIWIRPDKVRNARRNDDHDTWVLHVLDHESLTRCIHLTAEVCDELLDPDRRVYPRIRGQEEEYVEIRPDETHVKPVDDFLDYITTDDLNPRDSRNSGSSATTEADDSRTPDGSAGAGVEPDLDSYPVRADIEDGETMTFAGKVVGVVPLDDHDQLAKWVDVEDPNGEELRITFFDDSEYADFFFEKGRWYEFEDITGDEYQGRKELKAGHQLSISEL